MYRLGVIIIVCFAVFMTACAANETANQNSVVTVEEPSPQVEPEAAAPAPKITCNYDSECGQKRVENAYCFQGQPTGEIHEWKCDNPGTPNAKCVEEMKKGIIDECNEREFCRQGKCISYANCEETDMGLDYETKGKVSTNEYSVYTDYCRDENTLVEYYCSSDNRAFSEIKDCNCYKGECTDG